MPPYTAWPRSMLADDARLPVFVDSDIDTFQIDARKVEQGNQRQDPPDYPVHLVIGRGYRQPSWRSAVVAVSRWSNACQAHLAEWRGRKVGTYGRTGCFSFSGQQEPELRRGWRILTDDENARGDCYRFHNNTGAVETRGMIFPTHIGANLRMSEFQAALLTAQMTRLEAQARTRDANGAYLTSS